MFHKIYILGFMATFNNYINLFVLQESGDITEGVRLWRIKWGQSQWKIVLVLWS